MDFRIYLTGHLRVEGPGKVVGWHDLSGPQARLVLGALIHVRRPVHRDWLADVVWDSRPPGGWSASLNAIVSKLRRQLDECGLGRGALLSTGGTYELVLPAETWVDTEDAVRRADRAEGAFRSGNVDVALPEATAASSILRRPFLAGVQGWWVEEARRSFADRLHRCWTLLAEGWNTAGDHQLAAIVAGRAIRLDPLRETAHQQLILAELGRGDAAAAARAYQECADVLAAELGVEPSARTRAAIGRTLG